MHRKNLDSMPCPIARSLERVGEWWSILILRDALHGLRRFDEFQKSLGIAPNMLTRRLNALVDAGLLERRRYSERPPRDEYVPTARGRDFRPVLIALLAWGNKHFAPEGASVQLVDTETGATVDPIMVDSRDRTSDQSPRICVCTRSRCPRAHAPEIRIDRVAECARRGASRSGESRTRRAQAEQRMSVATLDGSLPVAVGARDEVPAAAMTPRTRALLQGPIVATLLRMAWPNVLVMVAQAATGLIETWFVAKLGTDALAGMALVFPGVMLMQMISAGAMGGGISSAIARALGGRPARPRPTRWCMHALIINIALGVTCSVIMLAFGRPIYRALGGEGAELEAALAYSNVVFAGNVLLWLLNGFASVIRGTGNMLVPALVICAGVVVLIPLSPVLIFGLGPFPALGIAGGGVALLVFYAAGTAVLTWYILSGRNIARLRPSRLSWPLFRDILGVGAVAAVTSVQTNVIIALATALVAAAGGAAAAAGYGTAARLEYLLIPLVFGLGAPLVAMVGTNIGAGQRERALRIAMAGGAVAFVITGAVGIAAAVWPHAWISLFSADPQVLAAGADYLRIVGPTYGFFGLALALYFASQGAGRLFWPLTAGFLRMLVAIGGGWLALRATGSLSWLFAALALGLFLHGVTLLVAIGSGAWFRRPAHGPSTVPS